MAISKVVFGNETLIDLTSDTVTAASLLSGVVAHSSDGSTVTGTITLNSAGDLSASGSIVTVPSGYYSSEESKAISAGSAYVQTGGWEINPTMSTTYLNTSGRISAIVAVNKVITPVVTPGYIATGSSGELHAYGISSIVLSTQGATTITPTESVQTAVESGRYTLGNVTVAAISSDYVGSNITRRDDSDLSATGSVVTAPAGYYSADANMTIAAGSFTVAPVLTTPQIGTVSIDSSTGVITVARSSQTWSNVIQANATQAGYISANTSSKNDLTVGASSTTYALSALSATNYIPGTTTQTIAAGQYLTGVQTIAGDTNLIAANIAEGVTIFDIVGTHSGGLSGYGIISVKAKIGDTVYCSDGNITIETSNNTDYRLISVPYAGEWTVTCIDLNTTRTKTITISEKNQCQFVSFSRLLLYSQGDDLTDLWIAANVSTYADIPVSSDTGLYFNIRSSSNRSSHKSYVYTNKTIDPYGYTSLHVTGSKIAMNNYRSTTCGVFLTTDSTPIYDDNSLVSNNVVGSNYWRVTTDGAQTRQPFEFTVDLTSIAVPFYVVCTVGNRPYDTQANRYVNMNVTSIYLE